MTIRYANDKIVEAVLLSRTETSMRAAVEDHDDVLELNRIRGVWVTEDCEPVELEFAWTRRVAEPVPEADLLCPQDLAASLVYLLQRHLEEDGVTPVPAAVKSALAG